MDLSLQQIIDGIHPLNAQALSLARDRTEQLVLPPRALGRLHEIGERLCGIQGTLKPKLGRKAVLVMAGLADRQFLPLDCKASAAGGGLHDLNGLWHHLEADIVA